ncbi:MAG: methyltransferase [Pseudoxanthomonas sp.]
MTVATDTDLPMQALAYALERGGLEPAQGMTLLLRARPGAALRTLGGVALQCQQSFRPAFEALHKERLQTVEQVEELTRGAARVIALPPRQREESRALLAAMLTLAAPGAQLVCSVANDEGARSVEKDLTQLAGLGGSLTKHHCRVFWSAPVDGQHDAALAERWRALDAPRAILGGQYRSRPGVFAWDRVDAASALLAEALPTSLSGDAADLGAGWGYLADQLRQRCAGIGSIDLYEAEGRALAMARENLTATDTLKLGFHWHDVTKGLPGRYDVIVSNPPFHGLGRGERPDIGRRFIDVAADALRPRGQFWMVANRHLPYEDVLATRFGQVQAVAEGGGFKVIAASGPRA